jgi:hypothetical protein
MDASRADFGRRDFRPRAALTASGFSALRVALASSILARDLPALHFRAFAPFGLSYYALS